jgi:hypothetical protein
MRVFLITLLLLMGIILPCEIFAQQQESITITTYYPAPYGVYRELRAQRMAIGDSYYNASEYCWEGSCGNTIGADADLVVEGNLGIGTVTPSRNLEIYSEEDPAPDATLRMHDEGMSGLSLDVDLVAESRRLLGNPSYFKINLYDDTKVTITDDGNVGIGTTDPNARLQINGAISRQGTTLYGDEATVATQVNLGVDSQTGKNNFNNSYATVAGGYQNKAEAEYSTVAGGYNNRSLGHHSSVVGGENNQASFDYTTVGGGKDNEAKFQYSVVAGGLNNLADGGQATVAGGQDNVAGGQYSTVGGGVNNTAGPNQYSTVSGGIGNQATGSRAAIGGGTNNQATGRSSAVPGGENNIAGGDYSFAAGRNAKADDEGSFVWADSQSGDYHSNGINTFNVRASGGIWFGGGRVHDIAEFMDVLKRDVVKEAELVSLKEKDKLGKTSSPYDENLIGVISSRRTTTLYLGSTTANFQDTQRMPVTLAGRVFVKVNNQGGNIKIGDPITSSSTPGIGMKATRVGKIIGYAMQNEEFLDKDTKEVLVFINVGYYVPKTEFQGVP